MFPAMTIRLLDISPIVENHTKMSGSCLWLQVCICVSQKTRKLYDPGKPFGKLRHAYSVKLVFSYDVKGIRNKITAKFRDTEHLRFEDTKRIISPEKFRDFRETRPGACFSRVPRTFRAREARCQTLIF